MAQFSPSNQTVQVTTGNVRTTVDFPNTSLGTPLPYPTGVFPNPLGSTFWDNAVSTANLNGQPTKYRYVQFKGTLAPAIQARPAAVWWLDLTMTTVTPTLAEAWGGASSFAGLLMPNSTDVSGLTTAQLQANGGAAVWIAVGGIVTNVASPAAAAGDQLFGAAADWTANGGFTKVAVGAATVGRQVGYAFGASPSTVFLTAESI
jgi:hypothetical protein